jgi:hypothetical protein
LVHVLFTFYIQGVLKFKNKFGSLRVKKIPGGVNGDFFHVIRDFNVTGVNSASKNEYQDTPGGKDGRCVRLTTYPLQVPMSQNM